MDALPQSTDDPQLRRTTSERIDQSKPAYLIVRKCGGLAAFCRWYGFKTSTVHSWLLSGLIPSRQRDFPEIGRASIQAWILHRSKQLGHEVEPGDFIEHEVVDGQ